MKIDDVVSLVSGGPRMTVQSVRKSPLGRQAVPCVWFEINKMAQAVFDAGALRKAALEGNVEETTKRPSASPEKCLG